jgi:polysaccharide biosynthesis protein PslJ
VTSLSTAAALRREPAAAIVLLVVGALAVTVVANIHPETIAPLALLLVILAAWHRTLLRWPNILGVLVAVILFVPIKRYKFEANLPFDLEPYRLAVAVVVACWLTSLLIDPRVRLRRTFLDKQLLLLLAAVLASVLANPSRVQSLSSYVAKSLTFFVSFLLVYWFVTSVIRDRHGLETLLRQLTLGTTIVAIWAIVERRTGYNVFEQLESVLPPLDFQGDTEISRGGRLRVIGSAQHPIALGALFAMVVPIAVYLNRSTGNRRWLLPAAVLLLGLLATGSRTAVMMLVAIGLVFLWLKPRETRRLWPLAVPAVVVVHAVLPGAIGTFRLAFFPPGGLINEQTVLVPGGDPQLAGGRIRQLVPSLEEASRTPLFGQGWGTRITGFDSVFRNAPILDNAWLGLLLELGLVGFSVWLWLLLRSVRRLGRASKAADDDDPLSWLYAALAAAIAAFGVGMFTYDAFSFIQIAFVFWILLAFAAVGLEFSRNDDALRISQTSRG